MKIPCEAEVVVNLGTRDGSLGQTKQQQKLVSAPSLEHTWYTGRTDSSKLLADFHMHGVAYVGTDRQTHREERRKNTGNQWIEK